MPKGKPKLKDLLARLQQLADAPLNQATGLPSGVYMSDEFLRLEEKEIFYKQWVCAGRSDFIPNPGDYLTHHLAYQPVTVMRQDDGEITAFSNVCLHRMMRLLEDAEAEGPHEVNLNSLTIKGATRVVLGQHPPGRLKWEVVVPDDAEFPDEVVR